MPVSTWSALMLGALPEDVRRRLVEEHLLDPRRCRAPFGIPSVAMDEPSFRPGFAGGMAAAVSRDGPHEYYDPRTGRGLAARDFSWSALAADLASA